MKYYTKYTYWVATDSIEKLQRRLHADNIDLKPSKKGVCSPLSSQSDVQYILPDVFKNFKLCRRQLSWYFHSPFKGKALIISSTDLAPYGLAVETVIQRSGFKPNDLPESPDLKVTLLSQICAGRSSDVATGKSQAFQSLHPHV